ncbi:MAG: hypothetical protein V2I67_11275 [Thermoanaerobaculales bacterium]|nr:hypothetical protein [Thermoanaerobaculales bacterium]
MAGGLTIDGLRAAIKKTGDNGDAEQAERFELMARRFEMAVARLVQQIRTVVEQVPELECVFEDEVETFTAPGFPGRRLDIHDQRLRITRGEDFLLFDPTANALLSAMGQVEIAASRPIPFMVEKTLYLIPEGGGAKWGYRSVDNMGGPLVPFGKQDLLKLLHAVFAGE